MSLAVSNRLAVSDASDVPSFATGINSPALGTSAEIVGYPRKKLPPVSDYAGLCAGLIRETFPAPSQHQTCLAAARMTGASPDTFDRILTGLTKSPDARLMMVVMAIRAQQTGKRQFDLGGGFAIRLIIGSEE